MRTPNVRALVEYRAVINLALATAIGYVGLQVWPFPADNPFLAAINAEKPWLFSCLATSYATLWITTPLIAVSLVSALATIAVHRRDPTIAYSRLPDYPVVKQRNDLFLILGEQHHPTHPVRVSHPEWLTTVGDNERIVLIEETSEVWIEKPNLIRLEARRAQATVAAGPIAAPVTIADLLRATLRHRPDRIIVGEVRGPEAWDLLQALNTGHFGSLSTIHANSAEQALTRLAHCAMIAGIGLSNAAIREAIDAVIQVVVRVLRTNGRRHLTRILAT